MVRLKRRPNHSQAVCTRANPIKMRQSIVARAQRLPFQARSGQE